MNKMNELCEFGIEATMKQSECISLLCYLQNLDTRSPQSNQIKYIQIKSNQIKLNQTLSRIRYQALSRDGDGEGRGVWGVTPF